MSKIFILVSFLCAMLSAQMGDCFTCHPKLIKGIDSDKNHHPMLTCIRCHKPNKTRALECGKKCFSCHAPEDMEESDIKEHKVFKNCRECHVNKIKDALSPFSNDSRSLRSIIEQNR